jgi:hypothetical protein
VAKANPVTEKPAEPATTPEVTETAPAVDATPAVTTTPPASPKGKSVDPLEKYKTEANGLTIYNFVN